MPAINAATKGMKGLLITDAPLFESDFTSRAEWSGKMMEKSVKS